MEKFLFGYHHHNELALTKLEDEEATAVEEHASTEELEEENSSFILGYN
ncbi:hypothetical protein [Shewanella halifaxensis]|nr:hypothetical protein [Shewanella halifaxensis]